MNGKELIKPEIETELYKYIAGILKNLDCNAIKIGGTTDHIHILNIFSRTISVSKMLALLKKDSSKWFKTKGAAFKKFHWQDGYGIFAVSQSKVNVVKTYIENQKTHHKKKTFREEFIELLKKYNIYYDERYL